MQEIAEWLEKLGMSEYAQRFAENDIDASVLPHLTDQNLEKTRHLARAPTKLLAAIAKLDGALQRLLNPTPYPQRSANTPETEQSAVRSR